MNSDANIVTHLSIERKRQRTTKPDWFRWAFFTSIRGWSLFTC